MAGEPAELDAEVAGQKIKFIGPLNSLIAVLSFVLISVVAYVTWNHAADTKEAGSALVGALREQTQALRESNCLNGYRGPDDQKASFCRQVAR
jgi:hypothetical protein